MEEKFKIVRTHDVNNRTNECSDKDLKKNIQFQIDICKMQYKLSKELGYTYIDTGTNFEQVYTI